MRISKISTEWIVSPGFDLCFFITSVFMGFLLIFLNINIGIDAITIFLFYTLLFDLPHTLNTMYMIFIDPTKEKLALFRMSCFAYLLGPIMLVVDYTLSNNVFSISFLLFISLYGSWHIFRQHYGFISLYQSKNTEKVGFTNKQDYRFFHSIFILGVILLHIRSSRYYLEEALNNIGIYDSFINWGTNIFNMLILTYTIILISKIFDIKIVFNLPKFLFMISCFSLLTFLVNSQIIDDQPFLFFLAVFTIHHNIQYHGIVYQFSRKNFRNIEGLISRNISKGFLRFICFGILISTCYKLTQWTLFGGVSSSKYIPLLTKIGAIEVLPGEFYSLKNFVVFLMLGMPIQHYFLDQKIWKISKLKKKLLI